MRKIYFTYSTLLVLLSVACLLTACSDDELNSKELKAYVTVGSDPVNTVSLAIVVTPVSVLGDSVVCFPVRLTRPTSADVEALFSIDNSLVAAYNTKSGQEYLEAPAGSFELLGGARVTVAQGKKQSTDSLVLRLKDRKKFSNPAGYLVPVRISGLSSADKGVEISTNMSIVYVVIKPSMVNIDQGNSGIDGTSMDRSGWTATASSFYGNYYASLALDGDASTSWFAALGGVDYLDLDMGDVQTVAGFRLHSNYLFGTLYNPKRIAVFTSNDKVRWMEQGAAELSAPAQGTNSDNPDRKPINFYSPVTARYYRFSIVSAYSGYCGIAEINAVKQLK